MVKRTAWTIATLVCLAGVVSNAPQARAQAGFPPPAAGMAPVGPDNATQFNLETLRQQQIQRQQFDQFQQNQRSMTDRNLETLRQQEAAGRRLRNADRAEQLERERRLTGEQGRQIQSRIRRNGRVAAETPVRREPFPSILIEDRPRRLPGCSTADNAATPRRCRR